MNYSIPSVKAEADNLIIRKDVKAFLRSFEERGATTNELQSAVAQLQSAIIKLGADAPVKANCLENGDSPFCTFDQCCCTGK